MSTQHMDARATVSFQLPRIVDESNHACEPLLMRLQVLNDTTGPVQTIGFTSCAGNDGVSIITTQLAVLAARSATRPILLVDGNLSRPFVERTFGVESSPGLLDAIYHRVPPAQCIRRSPIENLWVLPSGAADSVVPRTPFDAASVNALVASLKEDFDWVFFNLRPASECRNTLLLSAALEGVLLVVEAERTRADTARVVKQQLADSGVKMLGVVLNNLREYMPRWLEERI